MHVFEISSLVELVRVKRLGACVIIRQMRNMHVRVAWPGCIAVWRGWVKSCYLWPLLPASGQPSGSGGSSACVGQSSGVSLDDIGVGSGYMKL